MAPNSHARQAGFTLIEVMVAIMLMAIISLISWRAIDSVTKTSERLGSSTDETNALRRTFEQLERDIAWRTTTELPRLQPVASGTNTAPATQLLPASIVARRGSQQSLRLDLTRTAASAPGTWQRVQWGRNGATLYRAAGPATAGYPLPAPAPAAAIPALEGVTDFNVRAWVPGRGWVQLPQSGTSQPATGLEFTITRGTPSQPLRYRRVILLQ